MKKRSVSLAKKAKPSALAGLESLDDRHAVLAFLVLLVVALFLFDAVADQNAPLQAAKIIPSHEVLSQQMADSIVSKLTISSKEQDGVAFIVQGTIDPDLLTYFSSMDYEQIKSHLGIKTDFVIHFEDDRGMVVPMGNKMCVGSSYARINGIACS